MEDLISRLWERRFVRGICYTALTLFVLIGPPILAEEGFFSGDEDDAYQGVYWVGLMIGAALMWWQMARSHAQEWQEWKRKHQWRVREGYREYPSDEEWV